MQRSAYWALAFFSATLALGGCNLKKFFGDPRCYTHDDCDHGQVCSANLCAGLASLGTGRKCWASRDCLAGQTCQYVPEQDGSPATQRCLPAGGGAPGASCTSTLDCASHLRCDLVGFSGQCQAGGNADRGTKCSVATECLAGLTCAPDGTCETFYDAYPTFPGVTCAPETGGFRALFEVPRASGLADFYRLPFPSDVRVSAVGAIDLHDFPRPGPSPLGVDIVALYADVLSVEFDGFSPIAPITVRFSAPVDEASLTDAATLVDVTPGADFAKPLRAVATARAARTKYSCANRVIIEHGAGDVLQPRHVYAAILRKVRGTDGATAGQDRDLAAVLGATRPASDDALARAWDQHASLRMWLTQRGIASSDVQAAAVFTTGDTTATLGKIATVVAAAAAPVISNLTLCAPGVKSPCADEGNGAACGQSDMFHEIHGRMTFPVFQRGTAPYLKPADGGDIDRTSPSVVRTESVCVAFTIPKGKPMPVTGWPLVVYSHGTGGSFRSFADDVAFTLASGTTAFAAMSFDSVEHGSRKNGSVYASEQLVFNLLNPHAARDNALQGAADVLNALRTVGLVLPAGVLGGTSVTFDPRVTFFGHSQGGNAGALALGFSKTAAAAVLSGTGGGVVDGVLAKTSPLDLASSMKVLLGEPVDAAHPVMVLLQTYFDPSDPQAYGPLLIRRPPAGVPSKHVFHTYGLGDTYAPPKTLANMTEAIGLPLVTPVLEPIVDARTPTWPTTARPVIADLDGANNAAITGATFQYDPAGAYDGHFVSTANIQAVVDWQFFLQSYILAGTPHVP